METLLRKEVMISPKEAGQLEYLLAINGFKSFSIYLHSDGKTAIVRFEDESEYTIFILKDILGKAKKESGRFNASPDFDFMVRLEKKLKSYSKFDEFFLRKYKDL